MASFNGKITKDQLLELLRQGAFDDLLDEGDDYDYEGDEGEGDLDLEDDWTAPYFSAASEGRLERVKQFSNHEGFDVNMRNLVGETLLNSAVNSDSVELVRFLVGLKADVNAIDDYMVSPLHCAAMNSRVDMVTPLLEAQADPNLANAMKETPIMVAAQCNTVECVEKLLAAKADPMARSSDQLTVAEHSIPNMSEPPTLSVFLKLGVDANTLAQEAPKNSLLLSAAHMGTPATVKLLLDAQANPAYVNENKQTVLHMAAENNENTLEVLAGLGGLDLEAKDAAGRTALLVAAADGNVGAIEGLLQAKAQIGAVDSEGRGVLQLAVRGNHSQAVVALLEGGASVDFVDGSVAKSVQALRELAGPDFDDWEALEKVLLAADPAKQAKLAQA